MKIILGSSSKGRKAVLQGMGYEFEVMSPDIDEKSIRLDDPQKLTLALANAKADALIPSIKEPAILITSDQVVVFAGKIREKPQNKEEAKEFLRSYSNNYAETVTAVAVTNTENGKRGDGVDVAKVWFKNLPEEVIVDYVNSGEAFEHAGGFCNEDPLLAPYLDRIEGEIESVIGLPKVLTKKLIKEVS